jgi:transposase
MSDRFDHTLEHTLESKPGDGGDDAVTTVRRIELITCVGRRRQWPDDEKARIIVESLRPGVNVSEVARRHGLSPQQLFGWRREARAIMAEAAEGTPERGQAAAAPARVKSGRSRPPADESPSAGRVPAFAPVVVAMGTASPPSPPAAPPATGSIEISIGDAVVRVLGQVDAGLLTAVLRAVRRAS